MYAIIQEHSMESYFYVPCVDKVIYGISAWLVIEFLPGSVYRQH